MSKTIDEKVVEMKFDNSQFERNVSTTMSTLDKLKQALHLDGASKGLENVSLAAKKFDISPMSEGVESVKVKFSSLEVMAVTALSNITNSVVNAGKNLMSAFTTEPLKTGWNEYELKMGSVQTIMASTGESLNTVNGYLDELNKYSDDTIYSFSDMTQNIGKFTNAGVKLEDAVAAIKGVSNEAAISGANANEASRAMYNFAQALSAGYVKLIDWKSIENANMATVEFKNELIKTALELGTLVKEEDKYKTTTTDLNGKVSDAFDATHSFNESLSHQWMTTDVLTKTLGRYADETTDIGKRAIQAATEVKTFSMMMDTLKEAAQSGWAQTWENIFGDFNQGKELWTNLANTFGNIISKSANARNNVIKLALGSNTSFNTFRSTLENAGISMDKFQNGLRETISENTSFYTTSGKSLDELLDKYGSIEAVIASGEVKKNAIIATIKKFTGVIGEITGAVDKTSESVQGVTDKVEYFNNIVGQVIRGDFGNGEDRINALTEANYNYAQVQSLVNKIWERNGHTWENCTLTAEELAEVMVDMSDSELENIGYTEEQIKALRELDKQAKNSGTSLSELIDQMTSKKTGRELVIESFSNAYQGLVKVIQAGKKAFVEVFNPKSSEEKAAGLYNIIEAINEFSQKLAISDETADKFYRTFKGVFAILDLIRMVVSGGVTIAFKILTAVLGAFDMNILDLTAMIGDVISGFRDWVKENDFLTKGIQILAVGIKNAIVRIADWTTKEGGLIDRMKELLPYLKDAAIFVKNLVLAQGGLVDNLKSLAPYLKDAAIGFSDWIKGIKDADNIPEYIISGLVNGLMNGVGLVVKSVLEIAKGLLETIKDFLGIHSPSTEFQSIGEYCIEGLVQGIQNGFSTISKIASDIKDKLTEAFKNFDLSKIFAFAASTGLIVTLVKLGNAFEALSKPASGIGEVFEGIGAVLQKSSKGIGKIMLNTAKVVKSFSKILSSFAMDIQSKALLKIAIALGVLVGALILLTFVNTDKLWDSFKVVVALSLILAGLAYAMSKLGDSGVEISGSSINIKKSVPALLGIAASLLILAGVIKIIGKMDSDTYFQGFIGLIALVGLLTLFLTGYGQLVKGKSAQNIDKVGKMLIKLSVSLLLMVAVLKIVGSMDTNTYFKGFIGLIVLVRTITAFLVVYGLLSNNSRNIDKVGGMLIKLSISLLLMVAVLKLIGSMDTDTYFQGFMGLLAIVGIMTLFILALAAISDIAKGSMPKIGGVLLAMSSSMLIMALIVKIVGEMDPKELAKGIICVSLFSKMIAVLLLVVSLVGSNAPKIAATILAMSVAIGILAGIAIVLSLISIPGLIKGVVAIGFLSLIMDGMILATKNAKNCEKTIMSMAIAIGVMAASIAVLSFIDPTKLAGATIAIGSLMGMFALMEKSAKGLKKSKDTIIALDAAIVIIAGALYILAKLPVESALSAAASLSVVLLSLSGAMFIISKSKITKDTVAGIAVMAVSIGIIGGILYLLSGLPLSSAAANVALMSVAILSLSAAMFIIGKINITPTTLVTLGIMTATIAILGGIMYMLSSIDMGSIINIALGLGLLAGSLIIIAVGVNAMNGCIAGAAAMTVVALALTAFIPVLIQLCSLSLGQIGTGLIALAGAFTVIGVAGLLLAPIVLPLMGLGAAIAFIGVGALAAGNGLLAFANGISILVAAGNAGLVLFNAALTMFVQLIPTILIMVAEGIVNLIVTIGQSAPQIAEAVIQVVSAIITALTETIPQFVECIAVLIESILTTIAEHLPAIVEAGFNILMSILTGLRDHMYEIATTGGDIVVEFINGISNKLPDIIDAGIKLVISLIDGLANGIRDNAQAVKDAIENLCDAIIDAFCTFFGIHSPSTVFAEQGNFLIEGLINGIGDKVSGAVEAIKELGGKLIEGIKSKVSDFKEKGKELINKMKEGIKSKKNDINNSTKEIASSALSGLKNKLSDFKKIGKDLMDGFKSGINSAKEKVVSAAKGVANKVTSTVKNVLDINSPSKVFAEIGRYTDEGFVVGLKKYASKVADAAEGVGDGAINGISNAISQINNIDADSIGMTPSITPVLDMSSVRSNNLRFGANIDAILTRPVDSLSQIISKAQNEINNSNNEVINAINGLRDDLNALYSGDDKEIALYVDSKKLATSLAKPMNRQLNILSKRGAY